MTRNSDTLTADIGGYRTRNLEALPTDIARGRARNLETLPADIARHRILNSAEAARFWGVSLPIGAGCIG